MSRKIFFGLVLLILIGTVVPHLIDTANAQAVLELDAIVVEGRIQRPQASYIIKRATLDFGIQAKRKSFVKKIEATIDSEPF